MFIQNTLFVYNVFQSINIRLLPGIMIGYVCSQFKPGLIWKVLHYQFFWDQPFSPNINCNEHHQDTLLDCTIRYPLTVWVWCRILLFLSISSMYGLSMVLPPVSDLQDHNMLATLAAYSFLPCHDIHIVF